MYNLNHWLEETNDDADTNIEEDDNDEDDDEEEESETSELLDENVAFQ